MDLLVNRTFAATDEKQRRQSPGRRKKREKDRRRAKQDRRRSVSSGVIVSLSGDRERRSCPDRRGRLAPGPDFTAILREGLLKVVV